MQGFINRQNVERVAAEVFSGPRARYYLLSMIAAAIAAGAGLALAAIWLGLVLLVDETRKGLFKQISAKPRTDAARLALEIADSAALATAPALIWFARAELAAPLATALLAALLVQAGLNAKNGRRQALVAAAPFGVVLVAFVADGLFAGAPVAGLACAALALFTFASTLHQVSLASHAVAQNDAFVRQLDIMFSDDDVAAWEIDFARGTLAGGEKLAAVLGRAVSYDDITQGACFATAEDRALVEAAFAPPVGAMRRIALQHAVTGSNARVCHQGVVRTTPDGAPARLTCVTRRVVAEAPSLSPAGQIEELDLGLAAQARTLRLLANELKQPALAVFEEPTPASDFKARVNMIRERRAAIANAIEDVLRKSHESDAANLAKSQFLANMSHELRTPLNAVIGYAEILQEDAEDEGNASAVQDLNRILGAAKHLLSLLNEILDLSKIEAGRMDVMAGEFCPRELIDELVDTMRPAAEANNNVLLIAGPRPEGLANTDAMKVRQCLLNFLSNACKFTKGGEIALSYERREQDGVDQMFFTVRDTGIGMSSEQLARLFQPFVQADPSITQRYGGTGLGLTITRRLAQLLGGDVSVRSKNGAGSTFTLRLPANFTDASATLGAAAEIDDVQGAEGAPLVIVIEDEPDARELSARALTRAGFAVQGVGGGEAGLSLTRMKKPALVLLDIFLPDRSGWRVLQSLKSDPKTQDIPVIVLSVNEDRAHALSLGAAEHIVKPADRDMLAATAMRFARLPAAPRAAPATQPQKQAG
ncbi:histidine kinase [alpha proteobacterium U9-1i]|nr:histidine kinase [alpha proteobacterium U9-1i]